MLRILLGSIIVLSIATFSFAIYLLKQDKDAFVNAFNTRSKVIEVFTPDRTMSDYKIMKFSDGKSLTVPDEMLSKVKAGDSVIKLINQSFLIWKDGQKQQSIEL